MFCQRRSTKRKADQARLRFLLFCAISGPARDLRAFADATLLSFLLGNSDAHGKNFALLYNEPGAVRFAPVYDVVSTAVYPGLSSHYEMVQVSPEPSNVARSPSPRLSVAVANCADISSS